MNIWSNHGLVFKPSGQHGWIKTHAQVPTALRINGTNIIRVFFSSRPRSGLSLTTFLDIDEITLSEIVYLHPKPILDLGDVGAFDEHGIMPSSVISEGDNVFLYYSGWSRRVNVPYANYTGLAISNNGGKTFRKYSKSPILDEQNWGPFSATSPCVVRADNYWHMFYCSGTNWHEINGKLEHVYDIKHAISHDGVKWHKSNKAVIPQKTPYEAITRPTVYYDGERYNMFFCFRGSSDFRDGTDSYKIGYSYSYDLAEWCRTNWIYDPLTSKKRIYKKSWDDSMQSYPYLLSLDTKVLMLYNGNSFGYGGFGLASCSSYEFLQFSRSFC